MKKNSTREQWETELDDWILNNNQPIVIVKKSSKSYSFYYFIIFLLLITIGLIFSYKKISKFKFWVQDHFKVEKIQKIIEEKKQDGSLIEKINEIEEQIKKNSKKINILGISHNENFSVLQKNSSNDFITINHDWSLSREPKNIDVDEADKKFIEENTKP